MTERTKGNGMGTHAKRKKPPVHRVCYFEHGSKCVAMLYMHALDRADAEKQYAQSDQGRAGYRIERIEVAARKVWRAAK